MKKKDLLSVAMMGVCASLLMGACQAPANNGQRRQGNHVNGDVDQNFYNSLSPEFRNKFDQLDARGKANVMQMYRDNGSRDANRAVDMTVRGQRSRVGQAEVSSEKAEVAATTAPVAPVETKAAAPVEAEKIENKVSSATSTATTTVQ